MDIYIYRVIIGKKYVKSEEEEIGVRGGVVIFFGFLECGLFF